MNINRNFYSILSNWVSLTLLQFGNYIVPLVLTPYLIITLGIEGFGILSFVTAVNVFFRALVSYGFDLTGTKQIAEVSNDKVKVNSIFQDIIYAKIFIVLICYLFLFIFIYSIPQIYENKYLFLLFFNLVIADALFPVWLYQGMQNMKVITILKLIGRFSFVFLTMLFVKTSEDILYVPLIEGVISIIVSLISILWGIKIFSLSFKFPVYFSVKSALESSWHVFLSKIAVLFYTKFNIVLLGLLTTPVLVGYYSIAENIYMALRSMFNPIIQSVFPYLSKVKLVDEIKYNRLVRVAFFFILLSLFMLSISLYFLGGYIIDFLIADKNEYVQEILTVFSFSLVFSIGGYLSTILIIEGKGTLLSKVTFLTVIINLIIVYPSIIFYDALGLAYCFLIVQIFHFVIQLLVNKKIFKR
ncbi:oligosaccharide flippase family protein [Shewanella sp. ALD9]|uniref:oligosaccharide flippase family protein n=1 Tax=Shewanella sp. ALD9 TaxID=2058330 RepID=UPI000C325821|nr:oligosaccharide flippase family protein [Shewanella sp. ALD9]PKH31893.1 hypothetical protein CXF88_08285 [Shewanella sp. ALD9]